MGLDIDVFDFGPEAGATRIEDETLTSVANSVVGQKIVDIQRLYGDAEGEENGMDSVALVLSDGSVLRFTTMSDPGELLKGDYIAP